MKKIHLPWMKRSDRLKWRSAATCADLGELMAGWLEGDVASWPGYAPNYGPDEETTEAGLIPVLAACNRAGYVTVCSQPGEDPATGFDGLEWAQRAAVMGFVKDYDLLRRLADAADDAGLEMTVTDVTDIGEKGIVVTTRGGRPYTAFGSHLDYSDLRTMWPVISAAAFNEVLGAPIITIAAPEYGAAGDRLWDVLDAVTGRTPITS